MKKFLSILLALSMLLSVMPAAAIAVGDTAEPEAFCAEQTTGGVTVKATAPANVFPAGTTMSAVLIEADTADAAAINDAVAETRTEERSVAASYAFDITFYAPDGEEVQPDSDYGNVALSFTLAQAESAALETEAFHVEAVAADEAPDDSCVALPSSDDELVLVAESVAAEAQDGEILVTAESFSYYVVQFTYKTMQFNFVNYDAIPIDYLLEAVEIYYDPDYAYDIIDEDTGVTVSDSGILDAWYSDGEFGETDEEDGYYGWVLEPVGSGTAKVTVVIWPEGDEENPLTYEISIAIAERNDSEKPSPARFPSSF